MRPEETVNGKYPIRIQLSTHVPPGHFILCPIIKRTARQIKERISYG
jgi:hypothetical protein